MGYILVVMGKVSDDACNHFVATVTTSVKAEYILNGSVMDGLHIFNGRIWLIYHGNFFG